MSWPDSWPSSIRSGFGRTLPQAAVAHVRSMAGPARLIDSAVYGCGSCSNCCSFRYTPLVQPKPITLSL
jgi:hypothetical protein